MGMCHGRLEPWRDEAIPDTEPAWHEIPWDEKQRGVGDRGKDPAFPHGKLMLGRRPFSGIRLRMCDPQARALALVAARRDAMGVPLVSLGVLHDTMRLIAGWLRPPTAAATLDEISAEKPKGLVLASGGAWEAGPDTGGPYWANLNMYNRLAVWFDPPHHPAGDGPQWCVGVKSTAYDLEWPPSDEMHQFRYFELPRRVGAPTLYVAFGNGVGHHNVPRASGPGCIYRSAGWQPPRSLPTIVGQALVSEATPAHYFPCWQTL